jgi:hypothetical protein
MNPPSNPSIICDPVAFAGWVTRVATINEHFSEALRDTADIVATIDPAAAVGLYQAADAANKTVHALRAASTPPPVQPEPPPAPVRRPASPRVWIGFGVVCAVLGGLLGRL